jgi:4-hydroxy-tetrahydrodipicolinate reductase
MNIAIIGYGRMGKEIEKVALEKGHQISVRIDGREDWSQYQEELKKADVAIEFSIAQTAPDNILKCFELNIPVVSGTTGWLAALEEIKKVCKQNKKAFFYAPNFSIGVNVFFEINRQLARLMKDFHDYDISIEEAHHINKADAPSGTAIRLADDIVQEIEHKKGWSGMADAGKEKIGISSIREGNITGTHTVSYESEFDKIEITHMAKNRRVFAVGAVMAAEWLPGKQGCFGMQDLLKINRK